MLIGVSDFKHSWNLIDLFLRSIYFERNSTEKVQCDVFKEKMKDGVKRHINHCLVYPAQKLRERIGVKIK